MQSTLLLTSVTDGYCSVEDKQVPLTSIIKCELFQVGFETWILVERAQYISLGQLKVAVASPKIAAV